LSNLDLMLLIVLDAKSQLIERLISARGLERAVAAADVVHTARVALEPLTGDEYVKAVRELLAALEASFRKVGP
jgi:ornithine cyclodeaminase/alanine dehydrogenase-like protein (mu-crystallin family)